MASQNLHDCTDWVFSEILARQSERYGDRVWIQMVDSEDLSFKQADTVANKIAHLLLQLEIGKGDTVAVFVPNSLEYCYAWFGITRIGAVHVAVNTDYKGVFLKHVLNNSQVRLIFTQIEYVDRLVEIESELEYLEKLIIIGSADIPLQYKTNLIMHSFEAYKECASDRPVSSSTYRDPACVMYTSGTTGPAKGVVMPQAHIYLFGLGTIENMRLTEQDVFYIVLPLFHANAMFMQLYATLIVGARAVLRKKFSASRWIHDVVDYGATITNSLGVVVAFVLSQAPSSLDQKHKLRAIGVAPNLPEMEAQLRERFGIKDVIGLYGMTEVNIPLYTRYGVSRPGSCGKLWDKYYDLRIVDPETDLPLPPGTVGEIVVRPKLPFGFMIEYMNMPAKTVEAWRNFWFHTGDAARMDEEGYVYFIDRIKDCIRRRGENISSFDIEQVIAEHPAVAEVAAIAVRSDIAGAEDEIKVAVVLSGDLNATSFYAFCEQHLPRFAVPRYVEFTDALPKTPTNKIQKNQLRKLGITPDTWDRQHCRAD